MPQSRTQGGELFIVDNFDSDWRVHIYLNEWCEVASTFDTSARSITQPCSVPAAHGMSS